MVKDAIAIKDWQHAASVCLELLRRDIDDDEAHQQMLTLFHRLGFANELVMKTAKKFKHLLVDSGEKSIKKLE